MRYPIAFLALVIAVPVLSVGAPSPATVEVQGSVSVPVTTYHSGWFTGERITYAATVGETVLRDRAGKADATIFSISYVRTGVADPAKRPVLFAFNGGPGSSSDEVHLAFGPRRSSQSTEMSANRTAPAQMISNPDSLITDADLVFIDPVGTGFSRVLPGGRGQPYWSVTGDARAVAGFIRQWLRKNGRTGSPVFICGESYGGMRLGAILSRDAAGIPLAGAIFLSPALDLTDTFEAPGDDMPYILALPSEAAIAWYHKRVPEGGRTLEEVFDDARRFAETDYAEALFQGSELPADVRQRVAREVAERIGLPTETVLRNNLRVPSGYFVVDLLATEGLRVGRTDGRYTGPEAELAKNRPPFDDPAIAPGGSVAGLLRQYLVNDLGFKTKRPYITLAMNVNSQWDWDVSSETESYANITPDIGTAMRKNPHLRLFVAGGYYDLAVPAQATIYAFDHGDLPLSRVTEKLYASGHVLYQSESVRQELAADIRAFIQKTNQENPGL